VELGLTLLAQSSLPSKHWGDSFVTSVYLINRLPPPVLKNESPFSKLFGKPPNYTVLRSFGCLCFPLLRPYTTHKLSFRSKPCIFIGYCANQRGYCCFDPQSQKIYISRHVVFDESRFLAKDTALSQSPCKLTASPGTSLIPLLTISSTSQNFSSHLNSQIDTQTPSAQHSHTSTSISSADQEIDSHSTSPSQQLPYTVSHFPTNSITDSDSATPSSPQPNFSSPAAVPIQPNHVVTRSQT